MVSVVWSVARVCGQVLVGALLGSIWSPTRVAVLRQRPHPGPPLSAAPSACSPCTATIEKRRPLHCVQTPHAHYLAHGDHSRENKSCRRDTGSGDRSCTPRRRPPYRRRAASCSNACCVGTAGRATWERPYVASFQCRSNSSGSFSSPSTTAASTCRFRKYAA